MIVDVTHEAGKIFTFADFELYITEKVDCCKLRYDVRPDKYPFLM